MREVALFREPSRDYADRLAEIGCTAVFTPVLTFALIHLDELRRALEGDRHSGLVLTSPRAVDACVEAGVPPSWRDRPVYVVGPKTESLVRTRLALEPLGAASGCATSLAAFVAQEAKLNGDTRPLLFPCGDLAGDAIEDTLKREDIAIDRLVVYETRVRPDLDHILSSRPPPAILIFFSPSGVERIAPLLRCNSYNFSGSIAIAIGPSTEAALKRYPFGNVAAAAEPTPDAVARALHPFLKQ